MMGQFKTPARIQVEAIECGAVAYWIILGYFGKWISIEEARTDVGITKDGSNAYNIVQALNAKGLESNGFQPSAKDLTHKNDDFDFPCIAWMHKTHWVVVEAFDGKNFLLSDPARGHQRVSFADFQDQYSGLILSAKRTINFTPSGSKPNPVADILYLLNSYKYALFLFVLLGAAATIPTVALSSFVGFFTDTILSEYNASNAYIWLLSLLVGLYFLFSYLQAIILRRMHMSMLTNLIERTYAKLLSLPLNFYPLRDLGEISQRITLTVNLSNILTGPLATATVGMVSLFIFGAIMLSYNVALGVIVVILGIINFVSLTGVTKALSQFAQTTSMLTGRMTSNILNMTNNFQTLKANGEEISLFQQWSDNFSNFQDVSQQSSFIQKCNSATTSYINQLSDYIIVILSGYFILRGSINLGQFLSFRLIALAFLAPINSLAKVNSQFSNAVGDVNRLKDLWMAKSDSIAKNEFKEINILPASQQWNDPAHRYATINDIAIKGLSYKFSKISDPLFEHVDLKITYGDTISLTGPPGSGKTTLCQCLAYLQTSEWDEYLINSEPLERFAQSFIRTQVCYVSQSRYIFEASAFDNICVFDDSFSQSQVHRIIEAYGFQSIYSTLPKGLDTHIGTDSAISSSDRTTIHLLRALVRAPRFLIVDDIFSSYTLKEKISIATSIITHVPLCIFVTSDPAIVSLCSRSLVLRNRDLKEIDPQTVVNNLMTASHGGETL